MSCPPDDNVPFDLPAPSDSVDTETLLAHDDVLAAIDESNPAETYRQLIAQNDRLIRSPLLDIGREITARRTAIHTGMVTHWLIEQRQLHRYDRQFALVSTGGTGRGEMSPCSDTDFAIVFEDEKDEHPFLKSLLQQTIHTKQFENRYGFPIWPQPFNLDHAPTLRGMQLNAFLDMRAAYDPHDLTRRFRERVRATFDPFEHFLHVSQMWRATPCSRGAGAAERFDRFDIKNEGLRTFLAGVWTLGGPQFRHSLDVYRGLEDKRDLDAYYFLLRIRAFIHLRRGTHLDARGAGSHPEDIVEFEDLETFGEMLAPDATERERFEYAGHVRARLLAARRRVERFARGKIGHVLQQGHKTSASSSIVHGVAGLRHDAMSPNTAPQDRSEAALSLVLASQTYGIEIDPAELVGSFRNAGDWLQRVPQLSALFYATKGSLASSLEFLSQIDGALERLFPGYTRFEASLDERVLEERTASRGMWVREKLRSLDACLREGSKLLAQRRERWDPLKATLSDIVVTEAALLDTDHLAAVRLALVTKRLPLTPDDEESQADENLELHERFSSGFSGIPLHDYFTPLLTEAQFSETTIRVAEFLVLHRREFKLLAQRGRSDEGTVNELVASCGNVDLLRALFVFTCVDRQVGMPVDPSPQTTHANGNWQSRQRIWWSHQNNAVRWFNTRELYTKALAKFLPDQRRDTKKMILAGYGERERKILENLGRDFFDGDYRRQTNHFASHLVALVDKENVEPKVDVIRDGDSLMLGVATRDFRGLAACIAGALFHHRVGLRQAHLFSAAEYGLALDFFHLSGDQELPRELTQRLRDAVKRQLYITDGDAIDLPSLNGSTVLDETSGGSCCLRHDTQSDGTGLLYALTYKIYRHLGASIHALSAYTSRGSAFITIHLTLPPGRSLEEARTIVQQEF